MIDFWTWFVDELAELGEMAETLLEAAVNTIGTVLGVLLVLIAYLLLIVPVLAVLAFGLAGLVSMLAWVFILDSGNGAAMFYAYGSSQATVEISDVNNYYSPIAGTPGMANIYWSVGNARYEIENKRGGSVSFQIFPPSFPCSISLHRTNKKAIPGMAFSVNTSENIPN